MRTGLATSLLLAALAVIGVLVVDGPGSGDEPRASAAATPGPVAREARPTQLERPDPDDYEAGSPRRAAEAFLAAWHDREWDRAVHWSAPLWRRGLPAPAASLRLRLGGERLRGAYQRGLRPTAEGEAELDVLLAVSEPGSAEIGRRAVTLELQEERRRWSVEPSAIPSTRRRG